MEEVKHEQEIHLGPVTRENWREVAGLKVKPGQEQFVAQPAYYLALCHYGGVWKPLAVNLGKEIIGFLIWAVDPEDDSCWLGGIILDRAYQGRGLGKQALQKALEYLQEENECREFALSYHPENPARHLYRNLGFQETGEREGEEVVARLG